jgi:hypothetical protein
MIVAARLLPRCGDDGVHPARRKVSHQGFDIYFRAAHRIGVVTKRELNNFHRRA